MITTVPQWPYLVKIDGVITLHEADASGVGQPLGDYCGEWGSYLDQDQQPVGVRLMMFFDYLPRDADFTRASNVKTDDGDLIVLFRDSRLADAEMCPFMPVYRACLPDGREFLQLSEF
jgi:hypothetical protein